MDVLKYYLHSGFIIIFKNQQNKCQEKLFIFVHFITT